MQPSRDISRLLEIMAALRNPDGGCPWDLAQDFATIRHYTIEEAYEVADAIERKDFNDLREELGDLLLQPVFHAQMAGEAGLFNKAHASCDRAGTASTVLRVLRDGVIVGVPGTGFT